MLGPVHNRAVSSAKRQMSLLRPILLISFMYRVNKMGPIMDPCGTPKCKACDEDSSSHTIVEC